MIRQRALLIAVVVPFMADCGDATGVHDSDNSRVRSIGMSPWGDYFTPVIIKVGESQQFTATARDSSGVALAHVAFTWAVTPPIGGTPGSATVDAAGKVTGSLGGYIWVSACVGTICAGTPAFVQGPINSLQFALDSLPLVVGSVVPLVVIARDDRGNVVPNADVSYSSTDPTVATVDNAGRVTGVGPGNAAIRATAGSVVASLPVTVRAVTYASISVGGTFKCGLTSTHEATCWGNNTFLQLGAPTPQSCTHYGCAWNGSAAPLFVTGSHAFTQVVTGDSHACGLTSAGETYCWGEDDVGQLGTTDPGYRCLFGGGDTRPCSMTPLLVAGAPPFTSISAGFANNCALTSAGAAWCWGEGRGGQLGNGDALDHSTPVAVAGGLVFQNISAGTSHSCGVTATNEAYCWGLNLRGNLGIGGVDVQVHLTPTKVAGGLSWARVDVGVFVSCGITTAGKVYCWGSGPLGAPGTETCPALDGAGWILVSAAPCSTTPTSVSSDLTFTLLSAPSGYACALAADGAPYCWSGPNAPAAVSGVPALASVSSSSFIGCGVTSGGIGYCWTPTGTGQRLPWQP